MAKVIVSRKARKDLEEINSYIREELLNPDAAVKLMSELKQKIQSLTEFPERGSPLDAMLSIKSGYRYLPCGSYLIFYQIVVQQVEIVRILNNRQNYVNALFLQN